MSTAGRVPFSNSTEVELFRANRCARCVHRDPGEDDCEPFGLGVAVGEWPALLIEAERGPANPLGIECTEFKTEDGATS